jgi:hypothetical protein
MTEPAADVDYLLERTLGSITAGSSNAEVQLGLRAFGLAVADLEPVEREVARQGAIAGLEPLGIEGVTALVDSAIATYTPVGDTPNPTRDDNSSEMEVAGTGLRRPNKATRVLGYADRIIAEFYADPDSEPYLDVHDAEGVRRTLRVRSRETRALLDRLMYEEEGVPLGSQARQDALDVLEARARHSGTVCDVHVRTAEHKGVVWIDLGDATWGAIKVSSDGWLVIPSADVPVRFRRSRGMRALPVPARGGGIDELRQYVRAELEAFILIVAWLLGALRAQGPYAVLVLSGEAGSAKSTIARLLRALVDPHQVAHRGPPRDDRDVAIAATNGHVLALDNLSHLAPWLSDGLCRIACGGGYATRELYTDREETILGAVRPIIITGIEDVATRGDLADRSYSVTLPRIDDRDRRTEAELDAAFEAAAARILGALLDAVACGLRREPTLGRLVLPRMADAARWVVACEPACPWPAGAYLEAYAGVRAEMIAAGIAGDVVASAVLSHVERSPGRTWTGTADELLAQLDSARNGGRPPRGWPETPRALSGRLTRAAPLLRGVGGVGGVGVVGAVEVERTREPGTGRRLIHLRPKVEDADRHNRHTVTQPSDRKALGCDGRDDLTSDRHTEDPRISGDVTVGDGCDGLSPTLSLPLDETPKQAERAALRDGA